MFTCTIAVDLPLQRHFHSCASSRAIESLLTLPAQTRSSTKSNPNPEWRFNFSLSQQCSRAPLLSICHFSGTSIRARPHEPSNHSSPSQPRPGPQLSLTRTLSGGLISLYRSNVHVHHCCRFATSAALPFVRVLTSHRITPHPPSPDQVLN